MVKAKQKQCIDYTAAYKGNTEACGVNSTGDKQSCHSSCANKVVVAVDNGTEDFSPFMPFY